MTKDFFDLLDGQRLLFKLNTPQFDDEVAFFTIFKVGLSSEAGRSVLISSELAPLYSDPV